MLFKETGFTVKFLSEDVKSYYTVHLLQLENISVRLFMPKRLDFIADFQNYFLSLDLKFEAARTFR